MTPVVVQRQVLGLTERKTVEVPQLHCSDKVDDVFVVQIVVGVSWKVPQNQFIARVSGPSSLQRDGFLLHGYGGGEWIFSRFFRGFRAPPGCPRVERQFSEPSTTKRSLLSRAPAQFHAQHLST